MILVVREICFVVLDSLTAIISNTLFAHLSSWSRSSKFLFKEYALIWNKARYLCLSGNFKVRIWSRSWNLELTTFPGSRLFSGEVLLNWLYGRARSEGGFSESKLSLSLSLLVPWEKEFVVVMEEMKSLFVCVRKGKMLLKQERQYHGSFMTFHVNPKLTNVTLICRVFISDVYKFCRGKRYY